MSINLSQLRIRQFLASDFPEYQSWYNDPVLDKALGPMDEDWLEFILKDQTGGQFSILLEDTLLAVVGIAWSTPTTPQHTITDLAVHPNYRRKGLGKRSLQLLMQYVESSEDQKWIAWVDPQNQNALQFLLGLGWQVEKKNEEEEMHLLSWVEN